MALLMMVDANPEKKCLTTKKAEDANLPPKAKRVSFGEVRVREHERVLDGRSLSSLFAALELGWAHSNTSSHHAIDEFEGRKASKKTKRHYHERKCRGLQRLQTLAKYGYSVRDILKEHKKRSELRQEEAQLSRSDETEIDDTEE